MPNPFSDSATLHQIDQNLTKMDKEIKEGMEKVINQVKTIGEPTRIFENKTFEGAIRIYSLDGTSLLSADKGTLTIYEDHIETECVVFKRKAFPYEDEYEELQDKEITCFSPNVIWKVIKNG